MGPVTKSEPMKHPPCLYDNKALSDVTIKFGDQSIYAHKAFLGAKSVYFFRAFSGYFPVANSDIIDLGDDEQPIVIRTLIRHIYGIPFRKTEAEYSPFGLLYLIDIFTAADKYDVPTLRDQALDRFTRLESSCCMTDEWVMCLQRLSDPGFEGLADKRLRDAVVTFCAFDVRRLLRNPRFSELLTEGDPFAGQFLRTVLLNSYAQLGELQPKKKKSYWD